MDWRKNTGVKQMNTNRDLGLMDLAAQEKMWKPKKQVSYSRWKQHELLAQKRREEYARASRP
jgi:hypothetical protein